MKSVVRPWRKSGAVPIFEHPLFDLERQSLLADNGDKREAVVLHPTDWINVIPLGDDGRMPLVLQWRFGTAEPSLEIPGGMVDEGEDHETAARRELLEETGYEADDWLCLGTVDPNPAIQSNRCSTWLARGLVRVGAPEGDGQEEIEVVWADLESVPERIAAGEIRHSLVIAAFYLLSLHED